MDRHWYYAGIAFFGMINGMFNASWFLFAWVHAVVLSPALLFDNAGATRLFANLMVATATIVLGGIPAAVYERLTGAKDDSTETSLWIWLACTALLAVPAIPNFIRIGL